MAKSVADLSVQEKRELLGLKEQFAQATTPEERARISQLGDQFRSSRGIEAGSAGQFTADQLRQQIADAVTTPSQQISQQPRVQAPVVQQPQADFNQQFLDFQRQLQEAKRQQAISGIEQAAARSRQEVERQRALIPQQFEEQRTGLKTQSQLGGESFKKFLQRRGLEGSGAASQGEIARNVTLQGALGQSTQAEQQALTQAEQRLVDIETQRQFGIQQAESGIASESAQQALQRLGQLEQRQFQAEQAQLGREFDLQKLSQTQAFSEAQRQASVLDDRALLQEKARIDQQNALLSAEIAESRADNNLVREQELLTQKQTFEAQQAAINNEARLRQIGAQTGGQLAVQRLRGEQAQQQALLESQLRPQGQQGAVSLTDVDRVRTDLDNVQSSAIRNALADINVTEQEAQFIGQQALENRINILANQGVDPRILSILADEKGFVIELE